ncbi:MAG: DUF2304 family protein [Candidatus Moranbacteria bacterium]|jgi:hypothetical protein|nr:DUF2304 family protein [Candidatus Moranbacteria bacterium]
MNILTLIIAIFVIFAISRVFLRYKGKEISLREMIFWNFIWMIVLIVVLFPNLTTNIAKIIGIGRGVDTAFFISILLLFYLIFRLYVKIDKIDKDITELTIQTSKIIHKQERKR